MDLNLLIAAVLTAITLIRLYSKLKSRAKTSVESSNGACSSPDVEKKTLVPLPGSSIPDPDPLHDFDLGTATARNFIYANKTLRYPYYQVSDPSRTSDGLPVLNENRGRRWRTSQCTRTTG